MAVQDFKVKHGIVAAGDVTVGSSIVRGTTPGTSVSLFDTSTGAITLGGAGSTLTVQNLTVSGITTTVNSSTLDVVDTNITLAKGNLTDAGASGGGITLAATAPKTITYDNVNSNWTSSEHWNIVTGKSFKINNAVVLDSTTLYVNKLKASSTAGPIYYSDAAGTYTSEAQLAVSRGGTGASAVTQYGLLFGATTSAYSSVAAGTTGQMLVATTSAAPSWSASPTLTTSLTVPLIQGTAGAAGTITIRGGTDTAGTVALNAATINSSNATVALFATPTTVTAFAAATSLTIGGVNAPQTITIGGSSATTATYNFGTGPTAAATTKTVNIGTDGTVGSQTNVTLGAVSGDTTTAIYGKLSRDIIFVANTAKGVYVDQSTIATQLSIRAAHSSGTNINGGAMYLLGGDASTTGTSNIGGSANIIGGGHAGTSGGITSGAVNISGGVLSAAGNTNTKSTGSVYIDGGGAANATGTTYGTVNIGIQANGAITGTSAVNIGKTGITTTISGTTQMVSGFTKVGNTTLTQGGTVTVTFPTLAGTLVGSGDANTVANTMIRQSAGLSVVGRSANSTGNVADITGTDGQVLRVSGTTLGFGTVANAGLTNSSVTIGSTAVSLGSTVTTFAGLVSVTSTGFTGALTGNATTATTATNLVSGVLGSTPYQTGSGATSLLGPNTTTTKMFLRMTGSGAAGNAPAWDTVTSTDVGLGNVTNESKLTMFSSPTFTGSMTSGDHTNYRVGAVTTGYTYYGNTGTVYFGFNGTNFVMTHTGAFHTTGSSGSCTGNAATASNLTGTPTLPNGTLIATQAQFDSSTKLATTEFVNRLYKVPTSGSTTTVANTDSGKCIHAGAGGVTIPNSIMAVDDVVSIYNNTDSPITITNNLTTLYLAGTATSSGNRTLAQRGICTIRFISGTVAVIAGAGLS